MCLSSITYCCKLHIGIHFELPYRDHAFDSIAAEFCEGTKYSILKFLAKEKSKKEKLKKIALISFKKTICNTNNSIEKSFIRLDSNIEEINNLIKNFPQGFTSEPLALQSDISADSSNTIFQDEFEINNCVILFCKLSLLRNKAYAIIKRYNNSPESERDFRRICLLYENNSNPLLGQAYKELVNAYQKITSLYHIKNENLFIYHTENENEEMKNLEIQWKLKSILSIAQIPDGELFVIAETSIDSIITFIIDKNYCIRELQSEISFNNLVAIYFNRSVYCFEDIEDYNCIVSSNRFDLDEKRWIKLTDIEVPNTDDLCNCIIFNRNILISWESNSNLFLYTIETDSFSIIPYKFHMDTKKILINTGELIYLIQLGICTKIYESEAEDIYTWKKIAQLNLDFNVEDRIYCLYNKGGIFISIFDNLNSRKYFKFNLDRKILIEIAYYNKHIALRRLDDKIEAIKCYDQEFELDPGLAANWNNKGYKLDDLGKALEKIEYCNEIIKLNPNDNQSYEDKGYFLHNLDQNLEAIECCNEAIKIGAYNACIYYIKAHSLFDLGRYREALECLNTSIRCDPYFELNPCEKGIVLYILGKKIEAVECFNKVIKLSPNEFLYFFYRANLLNSLGQRENANQDFNRLYDMMSTMDNRAYFRKYMTHLCWMKTKINQDRLEILRKIMSKLNKIALGYQELRRSGWNEVNEIDFKEKHFLPLLKKAVKCLDPVKNKNFAAIIQVEKEVSEYNKKIVEVVKSYIPFSG